MTQPLKMPECILSLSRQVVKTFLIRLQTLADQVSDIRNTVGKISKNPVINNFKKLGSFLEKNTNVVAENAMCGYI